MKIKYGVSKLYPILPQICQIIAKSCFGGGQERRKQAVRRHFTPLIEVQTPLLVAHTPLLHVQTPLLDAETPLFNVPTPLLDVQTPLFKY